MCIISFYKNKNNFILTYNRDEQIDRKASYKIVEQTKFQKKYYSPIDKKTNGTWIFYSSEFVACILNGGEQKPFSLKEKYKKSRGIVLLDLLKYNNALDYANNENFDGIAPFTIFVFERITKKTYLLQWNEYELEIKDMTNQQTVSWCSSTLYSKEYRTKIAQLFYSNDNSDPKHIMQLHHKLELKKNCLSENLATTSISQIIINNLKINMQSCQLF